jgi:CRISPR/Cas system-associated exonuclease Cas4 (RecB family)
VKLSASTLKTWSECPLKLKFKLDGQPRTVSSAMSFGSALHLAVLTMETGYSLAKGVQHFEDIWDNLRSYDLEYDYLLPRTSHVEYQEKGVQILTDWWALIQWDSDTILGREYEFLVPVGDNTLHGFIDKLTVRQVKGGALAVVLSDYKTGSKQPTRDYLKHDLQFTSYAYASTQPEFWVNIPNGAALYEQLKDVQRVGEWVQLRSTKRIDAGERTQLHYNRLRYACDQIALSVMMGIFPPTISGESCEFCSYRDVCGLPSLIDEAA